MASCSHGQLEGAPAPVSVRPGGRVSTDLEVSHGQVQSSGARFLPAAAFSPGSAGTLVFCWLHRKREDLGRSVVAAEISAAEILAAEISAAAERLSKYRDYFNLCLNVK